jgi:glycyl-tRNA synthetase beta chain
MSAQHRDFLVEIGTEELPPKALRKLERAFAENLEQQVSAARLNYAGIQSFATPRRLAVLISELAEQQPDQHVERRGPPVKIAFDQNGKPTKAALKFADSNNVAMDALERLVTDKGDYLVYRGLEKGQASTTLLPGFVNSALADLPIPRRMRWGSSDVEFVRPVHWVVMLQGSEVVAATVLGLRADRLSFGHRFHAPAAISLASAADYATTLQQQGHVVAGFLDRKALILEAANAAATSHGGHVVIPDALLDEVTALVEWPTAVVGSFAESFLELPAEVLISTLQEHQRYFPVYRQDGALTNRFITISNIASVDPEQVRLGNEKVVKPRLADAAFFWTQDLKTSLESKAPNLEQVVYQKGLGSLADKAQRVAALAADIAAQLGASPAAAERAAHLAKADLLTEMVGEFPDLQGLMGSYYASHDGETPEIAAAIREQYLPRFAGDVLPSTSIGQALSIADKLDTLAGIFALGQRPSGSKDPFGLRRLALGMLRIIIESQIDLDVPRQIANALELQPLNAAPEAKAELYEFIVDRLKSYYLDGQNPALSSSSVSAEQFEAVRQREPVSPVDFHQRLAALVSFTRMPEAESLAAANKRIANILKAAAETESLEVQEKLFVEPAEILLYQELSGLLGAHKAAVAKHDYRTVLSQLATLAKPIDAFFADVMVNTDDPAVRTNRLALLSQLRGLFLDVADLSRL